MFVYQSCSFHASYQSFIRLLFSSDHIASRRQSKYVHEELEKKEVEKVLPGTEVTL